MQDVRALYKRSFGKDIDEDSENETVRFGLRASSGCRGGPLRGRRRHAS